MAEEEGYVEEAGEEEEEGWEEEEEGWEEGEEGEEEGWEEGEEGWEEGEEGWEEEEEAAAPTAEEAAPAPAEEGAPAPKKELTEEEEIAELEARGWVNTTKVKGPPARLAPRPPPAQEKMAAGKKDTWDTVKSERNWAADVDLEEREVAKEVAFAKPSRPDIPLAEAVTSKYTQQERLADGPFAIVYVGEEKSSGKKVALKVQSRKAGKPEETLAILKQVSGKSLHASLLLDSFEWEEAICLVLARRQGGRLFPYLARQKVHTEAYAAKILKNVLDALHTVHELKVVHLDVIPENILCVSEGENSGVVLEGFALSRRLDDSGSAPVSGGAVSFQSPEVIFNLPPITEAADMWAVGVLAYTLLTGELPFPERHTARLKVSIKKAAFQVPDYVSPAGKQLIEALLAADPAARPAAKDVLQMDFFKEPSKEPIPDFAAKIATLAK